MGKKKILIPLNQSELSRKVLDSVVEMFPADGNELILYYITRPPGAEGFGKPDLSAGYAPLPGDQPVLPTLHPIYESQQRDSIKAHVRTELLPTTNQLQEAGYEVAVKVGFSKHPDDSIARYARECGAHMVAMTTRGRVGVTRFFFRNIADSIVERADLPVMLVHTG